MNHFRIIIILIVHHGPLTDDPKSIPAWAGPITRLCTQTYLSVIAAGYWRWLKVKEVKKLNGFRWLCPVYPLSIQSFQHVFCFLLWQHSTLSSEYLNTFGIVWQIASEAKIQILNSGYWTGMMIVHDHHHRNFRCHLSGRGNCPVTSTTSSSSSSSSSPSSLPVTSTTSSEWAGQLPSYFNHKSFCEINPPCCK